MTDEPKLTAQEVKDIVAKAYSVIESNFARDRENGRMKREVVTYEWANGKQLLDADTTEMLISAHGGVITPKLMSRVNTGLLECGQKRLVGMVDFNVDHFIFRLVLRG
jgi:hypothetical protein